MDKALEDVGLEHIKRHIAQSADDAAHDEAGVLALAVFLAAEGNPGADRCHQELGHKRDQAVDQIVAAEQRIIEHRAEARGKTAQHRSKQHAGEQAHRVCKMDLRAQKRETEEGHNADNRCHHRDKHNLIRGKLFLFHSRKSPSLTFSLRADIIAWTGI